MVAKINIKKEINEAVELADDINHQMYKHCHLSLRGFDCEECEECSVYGRLVNVAEYPTDCLECDLEKCNDCSVVYYDAYAYFEDDISQEDVHKFAYELEPINENEKPLWDN